MKTGVIDVGGGFRGIYACGVLDYCLDQKIRFDFGIGVSAGSANLASFIAGQRGRNFTFYTEYGLRKQYASVGNLSPLSASPISFKGSPITTVRWATLYQWKRRLLPGAAVSLYYLQNRKRSSEPPSRTRSWLPASVKGIPRRRKSCGRERTDTMKALRWHRNMQNKGKC